ncbi:TonB-dependent receptor [Billgrantia lactosivorans]|uniref:TonB-dependent receptor n=1 Tax=Billgrantia lactosivorans TaxID=2185141 RepID=UPI000DAE0BB5|nr:TonB-dependent receptor [Halomonas lactosivorans]
MTQKTHIAWLAPVVLGSTLPGLAFGQAGTDEPGASSDLSPLVVTATRNRSQAGETPQKVTVINREQIEQQLAFTSDRGQILGNLIPGYSASRQKMTNSGETFRGRAPLYMIDGIPQSTPIRPGARDGYTIDLDMVERIEVLHGASAEHGLGATGGIINFVTRRAEPGELNQSAAASLTTDDEFDSEGFGHKLRYHINGQRDRWDYLAAVTRQEQGVFRDGDGRRIGVDNTQGEIQDSTSYNLFARLGYWLDDDQNLEVALNHFNLENQGDYESVDGDRSRGITTTARRGSPPGDPAYNESTTASLSYSHADWFGNELDAKLYRQRFEGQYGGASIIPTFQDPAIAPVGTLIDQSRNESDKLGAKLTLTRSGLLDDRLSLTTGLDLLQDDTQQVLTQTDRQWVPETQFRNAALFVQGSFDLTESLTLHSGVRQEYAELDVDTYQTIASANGVTVEGGKPSFDETLYNFGAVYQVTDWAQLFANYSEGFGLPDVGRVLRGVDEPGDVDTLFELEPIVTDNREIGTRLQWDRLSAELSYYESDSELGERLSEEGGTFVSNREKTEIRGVELSGELALNEAHDLHASYAWSEGEADSDGDGRVDSELGGLNIAPERLTLGWNARWNEELSSFVQFSHYFDSSFDDQPENLDEFEGYSLVDAAVTYRLPVGRVSAGIDNLLDEQYVTYYSQTARDGDAQYFAGRGRTFTLGYQLDF